MNAKRKSFYFLRVLLTCLAVLSLLFSVACDALPFEINIPWLGLSQTTTPESTPQTQVPNASPSPAFLATATPAPPGSLTLWLPPELDPKGDDAAALLLKNRLDEFSRKEQINIVVRTKAISGGAGMLNALQASSLAAPGTLPDVIALPRQELDRAVDSELVYNHPELTALVNQSDWYNYARNISIFGGEVMASAFLADPMVLLYHADSQLPPGNRWADVKNNYGHFSFAADDPQGTFLLMLYLDLGGKLYDSQGRISLDETILAHALQTQRDGAYTKHIRESSISFQNHQQVWEAYASWTADTALMSYHSYFLGARTSSETNAPRSLMMGMNMTLTNGWAWALSRSEPERQAVGVKLIKFLQESTFLAEWSEALGYVPARPSSLNQWKNAELRDSLQKSVSAAIIYPPESIMSQLGPVLRTATLAILRDNAKVDDTVHQTVESLQ